jgi:hypothetical protein
MKIQKKNVSDEFEVISTESFKAASANESKRSSISEPFENEIIPRSIHALVDKKTKEFITKHNQTKLNSESFGEEISSYYFGLTRLIEPKVNFDEDKVKKCMEVAEDHLTEAFYVRLFQNEEDENKDLELQRAIRSLHWIGPAMLEAKLDRSKTKVSNLLDDAVTCFLQTNSSLLPREKISHLSSGVECLLKSIEISTGSPGGADDLLPAIIFLLIYTNPPLFISNLNLIRRLAPPELLRRGEGAYHYCSICSAVQVIENGITASHLNLTRSQFKSYLTGTKPPLALMEFQIQRDSKSALGGIFERNIQTGEFSSPALQKIRNIKTENEKFFERARRLRKEMSEWSISVSKEVDEILTEYPLKLPTNTGTENVPSPNLELCEGSTAEHFRTQTSSVVVSPEDNSKLGLGTFSVPVLVGSFSGYSVRISSTSFETEIDHSDISFRSLRARSKNFSFSVLIFRIF